MNTTDKKFSKALAHFATGFTLLSELADPEEHPFLDDKPNPKSEAKPEKAEAKEPEEKELTPAQKRAEVAKQKKAEAAEKRKAMAKKKAEKAAKKEAGHSDDDDDFGDENPTGDAEIDPDVFLTMEADEFKQTLLCLTDEFEHVSVKSIKEVITKFGAKRIDALNKEDYAKVYKLVKKG